MTKTGPQIYPEANTTTAWYQDNFGGDDMEVNVVCLHTTEGTTLPDYNGGGVAPNLTAVPDFANKRLKWYQHFQIDVSSRALVNKSGGVQTNTNNVCQVELVGTCDPATHKKWTAAGYAHIFWPEAPDWALAEVAKFIKWMNGNHGVPLVAAKTWLPYPQSGNADSTARMSFSAWNAFKGVCGHMHVPENDHGDPGNIDIVSILALAGDQPLPTEPEKDEDMPNQLEENNANDVAIGSSWVTLAFVKDGILHTGPVTHSTMVTLYFDSATPADMKIQGVFCLQNSEGELSQYLVIDKRGGGGHQFVHSAKVPAGQSLVFRVRAVSDDSTAKATLLHRSVSGPYWVG